MTATAFIGLGIVGNPMSVHLADADAIMVSDSPAMQAVLGGADGVFSSPVPLLQQLGGLIAAAHLPPDRPLSDERRNHP